MAGFVALGDLDGVPLSELLSPAGVAGVWDTVRLCDSRPEKDDDISARFISEIFACSRAISASWNTELTMMELMHNYMLY